ncbi:MAG: hypothetical protein Kow006_26760 [Gammaproteobacteria bacterium]
MARRKRNQPLSPNDPLRHPDHARPVTRRDFIRQGFLAGGGIAIGGALWNLFPRWAEAALSPDIQTMATNAGCPIGGFAGGKIPFICFDLAGGANIAGSNVLVGNQGGQLDLLSTAGYSKLGLPGDMLPGQVEAAPPTITNLDGDTFTGNGDFTDTNLGIAFHSNSALLRGILEKVSLATAANINGAILPARSANDTGNNPHNPMYGIARAGATGEIVTLVGSRNSESGGNSLAPAMMIDPEIRPTKVDRPSDVTGMVDTGNLTSVLSDPNDVVAVMESMTRLSDHKVSLAAIDPRLTPAENAAIKNRIRCGYINSADIADRFAGVSVDPAADPNIRGAGGIFSAAEFDGDGEFRKTASVMKMVLDGAVGSYAGAGTITMGGYDYHTGDRATGELRDLRAGRCIGACLEYAARLGKPLMLYVFSDGSVSSNGQLDNSVNGGGKGVWTGDNSSTAASFFLVYSPLGRPQLIGADATEQARHQQIGYMRSDASVETTSSPAANNVNLLVETVILNYMALHGEQGNFQTLFGNNLASTATLDSLIAFQQIV